MMAEQRNDLLSTTRHPAPQRLCIRALAARIDSGPWLPVPVQRRHLEVPHRGDVQVEFRPEGNRLLVGHHLEEVEIPAAGTSVALSGRRADGTVVRVLTHGQCVTAMSGFSSSSHAQPRSRHLGRRQASHGRKERTSASHTSTPQAAVACSCRTSASDRPKNC